MSILTLGLQDYSPPVHPSTSLLREEWSPVGWIEQSVNLGHILSHIGLVGRATVP